MNYRFYTTIIAMIALIVVGCTNDSSADQEVVEDSSQTDGNASVAAGHEGHDHSGTTVETMPWTFLVDGVFHNNATIKVGDTGKENPNEGMWIRFKENGVFEQGTWGEKQFEGAWYYDNDTRLLEMHPRTNVKKSEWRVMHKDDNLVLVGTPKFGDNAVQMRFVRRQGLPQQK